MVAQLAPRPHLKQFFKRTNAAGQGQKSVAALGHHGFALVHVGDDVQLIAQRVGHFAIDQRLRDDAHHAPASLAGGLGHLAHQAGAPAAIDQLPAVVANPLAHGGGGIQVAGIVAGARTAVNAQGKSRFCVEHAWWCVGSNQCAEKLNNEPGQQGAAPGQTEQHQAEQDGGAAQVFGFFGQRVQLRANAVNGRFDAAVE